MIYQSVGALVRDQETISLNPQATVQEAAELMAAHRVGAVPVIERDGHLCGIFTERDLLNRVIAKRLSPEAVHLTEVMTADPITAGVGASLTSCLKIMLKHRFRHLPLLQGEQVVGVLSCRDIPADYWLMLQNWEAAQTELLSATA
ncbi:MAG TPA: CBS domain-containing protein [Lamprocystis sp. (in: g-proteobacteria)]|nr:CBS domain-containing protein [Lamprocystis sp. (in: g-proteobacteria)]